MMKEKIADVVKETIKRAAELLTGAARRRYQAEMTKKFLDGSSRRAEREFGWGRATVNKGLGELETGIVCQDNYSARGNQRMEDKHLQLKADILELVEPVSQTDPSFKTQFRYTRITAKGLRAALIEKKGWRDEELPCISTLGNVLNRLGYRLRRVQKVKPLKKIEKTDAIFDNVHTVNKIADADPKVLRISVDVKAKVNVGNFSREGEIRSQKAPEADDHDMSPKAKLVPVGILEVVEGRSMIIFGNSKETSDLIVDCLELWWKENRLRFLLRGITELVINLDNGPHVQAKRTWFLKRMAEFSDKTGLKIHLAYYPPYHSKYNPVERLWGILENHWNGALLDSVDTTLEWAKTMTWKGIQPIVQLLDEIYESGRKLSKKEMKDLSQRFVRNPLIPKWDVLIAPAAG
jgi:transposase